VTPFPTEDFALDEEIARVYTHLNNFQAETEEYQQAVDQLSKLYELKNKQNKLALELHQHADTHAIAQQQMDAQYDAENRPFYARISPDAALAVAGNLVVALIVVKYEQTGVISSQVRNFIKKI
jgi:hypothetical protein